MEKTISNETLERIKTLPRLEFTAFQELIKNGTIKRKVKLKAPRTIFFDEITKNFLYLNPYHGSLCICGMFNEMEG